MQLCQLGLALEVELGLPPVLRCGMVRAKTRIRLDAFMTPAMLPALEYRLNVRAMPALKPLRTT